MILKRKNKIKVGFKGEAGAYSEEKVYFLNVVLKFN
jgi:hypothetical protein